MRFDLHCHTTASDGVLAPRDLVRRAAEKGVEVLAVTDHDTLAGLDEVRATITAEQLPLRLVSGVEISTAWEHNEIHIVALGVDEKNPLLMDFLAAQLARREARAQEIGRRLEKCQIPGTYEEAKQLAGDAAVTRAHFARVLVARGIADNMQKVFKKYLSRGNKGYAPADWPEMAAAIAVIHSAGGLAVLAHPSRYDLTAKWIKRLLVVFKAAGGDAMEVSLPQQSPGERANLGQWAKDHDLYVSVGSDFHFPSNWTELGRHLWLPKEGTPLWLAYPGHFGLSSDEHQRLLASRAT
ncbi:putative metal-dependent phosphoesterase TrpH [Aeromonas sp. BIGb0405]|uniref:RNase RNM n=1 Tax=Aeromonas sp. BIGb0405 TaxID=2940592 RepID=UPI002168BB4B|nr:PHP domain-containing protein [Aeromonas sp. BIGb0405]MCS3454487.1 putative metal-dependent phosphoesterase TrpH [Aeromonas sp. BIGb0405]